MAVQSANYQHLAKRLLTLPFYGMVILTCSIYTLNDLLQTTESHIQHAQTINQLLAKAAAGKNTTLVSQQVETVIYGHHNIIRSINFFPISDADKVETDEQNLKNYLFSPYLGISEPVLVVLQKRTTSAATTNELIGYMNVTLDMQQVRRQWLSRNLPIWLAILALSLLPIYYVTRRINRYTSRLPLLENLSEKVLQNADIKNNDEDKASLVTNEHQQTIFEKALLHLINKQKMQHHQIALLSAEQMDAKDRELRQIQQYSSFQNTITQELKLSLNRIQSGLQLLQNQYVSNEQKDAVDIINLGTDDLNAKLNQIIQMMRIEKGQTTIELTQFSPTQLITDINDGFQIDAREKNILLSSKTYHGDYFLEGDYGKIKAILSSLVDNAIKFTETGSVTIISKLQHLEHNIRWTIEVQDTGIGIDEKYLGQIFQPFFQVEPDRKHNFRHNHIGLFLAKKLAEIMSAELTVTSQINQGTTFSLSLILDDWKNAYNRNVLKDKLIDIWYIEDQILDDLSRLTEAGAQIQPFSDNSLLLQHIMSERVDALLISHKIPLADVKSFIKILREFETSHRALIIVYYKSQDLSPHDLQSLKVLGADYLENIDNLQNELDDPIEKLINYLQ